MAAGRAEVSAERQRQLDLLEDVLFFLILPSLPDIDRWADSTQHARRHVPSNC